MREIMKPTGGGVLRACSANAETGKIAGGATTATSATPKANNASAATKRRTGDATSATRIIEWG